MSIDDKKLLALKAPSLWKKYIIYCQVPNSRIFGSGKPIDHMIMDGLKAYHEHLLSLSVK